MAIWPFGNKEKSINSVPSGWGWKIFEANTGFWQRNIEYKRTDVLCYHAVFACITLIASDISKLGIKLVRDDNGIWVQVPIGDYAVLEKPNNYQNRIQFFESWILSKLIRGNAYIYKEMSGGRVRAMHVLHPDRVLPLVTDEGDVFYQLGGDNLSGIQDTGITVPASVIIHDRFNCMFHPLVGLSPLFASGLPAYMGMKILENSSKLFQNGSRPSGILTVPEAISKERAAELSEMWETKYGGENYGKTAILGGDLKYQPLTMKADEAQLVEQLRLTAEQVCSTFHVPPYKIGVGTAPSYNNVQALNLEYYNSALHRLIEDVELCLDEGLEIEDGRGVEFDLNDLLRMDTKTQIETLVAAVRGGIDTPNEARKKRNQKPLEGGNTVYLQHQDYPIEQIYNRNDLDDSEPEPQEDTTKQFMGIALGLRKHLKGVKYDA